MRLFLSRKKIKRKHQKSRAKKIKRELDKMTEFSDKLKKIVNVVDDELENKK